MNGCGSGSDGPAAARTVTAKGSLTSGGTPLAHYRVTFVPESNLPAAATTDENGKFTLGTNSPGDGAVAGRHKVAVVYVGPPDAPTPDMDNYKPLKPPVAIPKKEQSAETTDLIVEIPAGGSEDLKIEIKP
ncbi:MAG TPA: hypothetical protein VM510_11430 [Caulifigura sp.]|nr:hypothetical protein [Caulifigura sp.]